MDPEIETTMISVVDGVDRDHRRGRETGYGSHIEFRNPNCRTWVPFSDSPPLTSSSIESDISVCVQTLQPKV